MTPTEVTTILRQFNEWQRGHNTVLRPSSIELGEAIDAAVEMIERLEEAESDCVEQALLLGMGSSREAALMAKLEAAEKERYDLRARIESMERQEPVAWCATDETGTVIEALGMNQSRRFDTALYLAPGAQPTPIEQDTSVRKAWARFSNELHRSPDAPYPGMSEAFEQHFSQSFTDREWRAESATWAAAWKAAKRHEAQAQPAPSFADAYQGAMEEVAIWKKRALEAEDMNRKFIAEINGPTHMGEPAQPAPSIPEGWKLVPIEPTQEIRDAWTANMHEAFRVAWRAALEAATEAKP